MHLTTSISYKHTFSIVYCAIPTTLIGIVWCSSMCNNNITNPIYPRLSPIIICYVRSKSIHFTDTTPLHIQYTNLHETVYYPLKIPCTFFFICVAASCVLCVCSFIYTELVLFQQNRGSNKFDHIKQNCYDEYVVAAYRNLILFSWYYYRNHFRWFEIYPKKIQCGNAYHRMCVKLNVRGNQFW